MNGNENGTQLGFLIFPGFPMACLTSAIEPLRAANEITGRKAFTWTVIGETTDRVASSAEVGFDPDIALKDVKNLDHLFLLSGPLGEFENPKPAQGHLRQMASRGLGLGGFSGGVFPLVRTGLMSGYQCSVHWCYEAAFKAEFPEIDAQDSVITIDRNRFTASGATAVFDLMLRLINDRLGSETMTEVACWFQHPFVRRADESQKVPVHKTARTDDMIHDGVLKAIRLLGEHIEEPIRIADVAAAVAMSTRQLERRFKRYTGQSPLHYYRMIRMKKARQMVLYSNDSMAEIAYCVGYTNATTFTRYYTRAFGLTPKEERENINTFRVSDNAVIPAF